MPKLLDTQLQVLHGIIRAAGFQPREFAFMNESSPSIRWALNADVGRFAYEGESNRQVTFTPGNRAIEERFEVAGGFEESLQHIKAWLGYLKRELRASDATGAGDVPPQWLALALPYRYAELSQEITQRQTEQEQFLFHGRLLWQTGQPLNYAVRDVFRAFGYTAELTEQGATYDVTVTVGPNRRLLIEVTGIEGAIQKASGKISQLLQVRQVEAIQGDRVVLAANVHRSKPLNERSTLEPITADAMRLVAGLDATFLTTHTLYLLWVAHLSQPNRARDAVEALYAAEGKHFTWTP